MNNNIKLLLLGLIIFAITLIMKAQGTFNESLSTVCFLIALIIIIVPLYKLVFNKLKK